MTKILLLKNDTFDDRYVNVDGDTMTGDLGFTGKGISLIDYVAFNTAFSDGAVEGRLSWNPDDGTLNLGMPGGNVTMQIGEELMMRATNDYGAQIDNGKVVRVSGGTGNFADITLADKSAIATAGAIGLATEDIANGQKGYVTKFGLVRDINTLGMAAGSLLWLGDDGAYQTAVPTPPDIKVVVGIVIREHATEGIVLAAIQQVPRLSGLSDVIITAVADNDLIAYDSATSVYTNQTPTEAGLDALYVEVAGDIMTGALTVTELTSTQGRIVKTTRVTAAYTLLVTDHVLFADTDGGAFTVDLPAGVEGQMFRITNVGTSANALTIAGDGAETVYGSATQILYDGEVLVLVYSSTEGWF